MKKELQDLLARGKTEKVIEELLKIPDGDLDEDLRHAILLQANKYKQYSNAKLRGTLEPQEANRLLAEINDALLSVISQLSAEKKRRRGWWFWVTSAAVVIGVLAGIAEISGYSLKDLFQKEKLESPEAEKKLGDSIEVRPEMQVNTVAPISSSKQEEKKAEQNISFETTGDQSPAVVGDKVSIGYGGNPQNSTKNKEKDESAPTKKGSPPKGDVSLKTEGTQSPAVMGKEVNINYSNVDPFEEKTQQDTIGTDSTKQQ